MQSYFSRVAVWLFLTVSLGVGGDTPVKADERTLLPSMESLFSVHIAGIPAGTMIRKLSRENGVYTAYSELLPGFWFRVIQPSAVGGVLFDQSRFSLHNRTVRGSFFEEHWKSVPDSGRSLTYDWGAERVRWGDGREAAMPGGWLVDNGSYPYSLMLADPLGMVGERLTIMDGELARPFEIIDAHKSEIETALGRYPVWQIDARRRDHPNERFSVSLAPELRNIPVVIRHVKNNITTELRIQRLSFK